ncbi:hypothetical protein BDR26DRAFT_860286, partial [Obelidium mucronatum]
TATTQLQLRQQQQQRPCFPPISTNDPQSNPRFQKLANSLPTHFAYDRFSLDNNNEMISLSEHGLKAAYVGPGISDQHSAAVRCNRPIPRSLVPIFYFEVFVVSKGKEGYMGVGCCAKHVNLDRLPGKHYGPTFTTADYVGCIVNHMDNTISYTKNGTLIGVAFRNLKPDMPLYPTVGFRTTGEAMQINFGSEPFKFPIEKYITDQQTKLWKTIQPSLIPIPPSIRPSVVATTSAFIEASDTFRSQRFSDTTPDLLLHQLILQHLEHTGYCETASIFQSTVVDLNVVDGISDINKHRSSRSHNNKASLSALQDDVHQNIHKKVMAGNIAEAITLIETHFPALLSKHRHIYFALLCQQFVEAVLTSIQTPSNSHPFGGGDSVCWEEYLISLGQNISLLFREEAEDSNSAVSAALVETFGLLAYTAEDLAMCQRELEQQRQQRQEQQLPHLQRKLSVGPLGSVGEHRPTRRGSGSSPKKSIVSGSSSRESLEVQQPQQEHERMPLSVMKLLDPLVRDHLASMVDACILTEMGRMTDSVLERNLKQCIIVREEMAENGGPVIGVDLMESLWRD